MLNTTDYWKKVMVALPDEEFFTIMRNYLGKLKTPFNKHSLIDDLADFLLREETEKRILSLIDKEDSLILTSIDFLAGTDINELHDFLGPDRSFMLIHHLLLNLEERLLIYRDFESGRLRISPVFEDLLRKRVFNTDLLFPSMDCSDIKHPELWLTDALVTSFISFIFKYPDLLKLDGSIKKKANDGIARIFPNLFEKEKSGQRLDILIQSLNGLALLTENDDEIVIAEDYLLEFSKLGIKHRYMLYAASIVSKNMTINMVTHIAEIIERLLNAIPKKKSFTLGSIKKLLLLIIKKTNIDFLNSDSILDSLITLKLLVADNNRYVVNNHLEDQISLKDYIEPPLIVQQSFDIIVKPWLSLKDGIKFASLSEIKKYDIYPDFELNRASYTRGHGSKLHSTSIISTLEELSARPIPKNILVSVESWEEEYNRVKLYEGIILTVSADKRIIIEHLENLQIFIIKELSPGIYLMDSTKFKEWKSILEDAGINVPGIKKAQTSSEVMTINYKPETVKDLDSIRIPVTNPVTIKESSDFLDELNSKLNSLHLKSDETNGFKIRISKKLILFPDQIQHGNIRTEKTEASGMDYIGKVRLIERAIENKSELLEVTFGNPIEKISKYLVKPMDLDKSSEDLLLNAISLPEENKMQLIVRKMSKVKRLKSSLFAPPREMTFQ